MNHIHTYFHLWQTLLLHTSYAFWSIGLACEVTRPHTPQLFLVEAHKEHSLLAKNCRQRKKLCSKSCSPLTAQGETIKLSEKTSNSLLRCAELCIQIAVVILNTNQCKITDNLYSQLANITKNWCLSCALLCGTQFSSDAAHTVKYDLIAAIVLLCYQTCHSVSMCNAWQNICNVKFLFTVMYACWIARSGITDDDWAYVNITFFIMKLGTLYEAHLYTDWWTNLEHALCQRSSDSTHIFFQNKH